MRWALAWAVLAFTLGLTAADYATSVTGNYSYTVTGSSLLVMLTGAGGGNSINVFGGRGGYTEAVIPTTPGETLFIIVGAGGLGIGSGANYLNLGGGGGGGTAIMRGNTPLLVAGGGGGAGSDNSHDFLLTNAGGDGGATDAPLFTTEAGTSQGGFGGTLSAAGAGGVGSSRTGNAGSGPNGGSGGVQTNGCVPSTTAYGYGYGGCQELHLVTGGVGGGGGGYYGGGAGGASTAGGGGGGGSSYAYGSATNVLFRVGVGAGSSAQNNGDDGIALVYEAPFPSHTPTAASTNTMTSTATATPTPTISNTGSDSGSMSPSYSSTISLSGTSSQTMTPTISLTPSNTNTATATATPTPSPTISVTSSTTPTMSPSFSSTSSPTISVTSSTTPSMSPSMSSSVTPTISLSPSNTNTMTSTRSISASASRTVSLTPSISTSPTPTYSGTGSTSATRSGTRTTSRTATVTITTTTTSSQTATVTVTITPTASSTRTVTTTGSVTVTASTTPTYTPSPSASNSLLSSPSRTPSPSQTISITASVTRSRSATPSVSPSAGRLSYTERIVTSQGSAVNPPTAVAANDFNLDGRTDLVAAYRADGTIMLFSALDATGSTFGPGQTVARCNLVATIVVVDMDGDGDPDVVAACSDSIIWVENLSGSTAFNTTFATRNVAFSSAGSSALMVADVTYDGLLDIVATNYAGTTLAVFTNAGRQVFTSLVLPVSLSGISSVFASDLDKDGDFDVVYASASLNKVGWMENIAANFYSEHVIDASAGGASSVVVLDLDGDGDNDVIACAGTDNDIMLYNNIGGMVFSPSVIFNAVVGPSSVVTADMDQDGDLDVLITSNGDGQVIWFENFGGLTLLPRIVSSVATGARHAVAYDVDGDGDVDVVSASSVSTGRAVWYQNSWTPSLVVSVPPWNTITMGMPYSGAIITVNITEVNGISTLTAGATSRINGQLVATKFRALGAGKYSFTYNVTVGDEEWPWLGLNMSMSLWNSYARALVISQRLIVGAVFPPAADAVPPAAARLSYAFFQPGSPLARVAIQASGAVSLQMGGLNTALASVGIDFTGLSGLPAIPVMADFDNDYNTDLLVLSTTGASLLFLGSYADGFSAGTPPATVVGATAAVPLDFNADGFVDLLVLAPAGGTKLFMNAMGSMFNDVTVSVLGDVSASAYTSAIFADLTGDGLPDLFLCGGSTSELYVKSAAGTFSKQGSARGLYAVALTTASEAAAADVNLDGYLDIVVVCNGANRLFINNKLGVFADAAPAWGFDDATQNSDSMDIGDVNMDGLVDIVVTNVGGPTRLFINGRTTFTDMATSWGVTARGPAVLVDVDQDGDLDLPGIGVTNPRVRAGLPVLLLYVSPLGRLGNLNQQGATVVLRRSTTKELVGVSVASQSCRKQQGPYDARFTVPSASVGYDVSISFVTGVQLNASVVPDMGGLVPTNYLPGLAAFPYTVAISQIPFVSRVTMTPLTGTLGVGGNVTVFLTAGNREANLIVDNAFPSTINGGDVSGTFTEIGNGVYSFLYLVQLNDANFRPGGITFQLFLADAQGTRAPVATEASLSVNQTLASDASPPTLLVTGPKNGTAFAVKSSFSTILLRCDDSAPASSGCQTYWFSMYGGPSQPANITSNTTAEFVVGPFVHGERPVLTTWTVDYGGNISPVVKLLWSVDLNWPVSTWSGVPPPLTNQTSVHLTFTCSKPDCAIEYTLDNEQSVWINGFGNSSTQLGATLDTAIIQMPPYFTNSTMARFVFYVNSSGVVAMPDLVYTTIQLRLEGASAWVDCRQLSNYDVASRTLVVSNLTNGLHVVEARAVLGDAEFDVTPVTIRWTVDTQPPSVSFKVMPPATSTTPSARGWFIFTSPEGVSLYQYRLSNTSAWVSTKDDSYAVTGYMPSTPQYFEVRAIDYAGNTGPSINWTWVSAACPPTAPTVTLRTVPAAVGRRIFVWKFNIMSLAQTSIKYTFAYRLDNGPWTPTTLLMADISGLTTARAHSFDLKVVPVSDCLSYTTSTTLFSASWYEYDASPGVPAFVSTPDRETTSVFPRFEFNSTAKLAGFVYSLDGSSWQRCASPIQLGPVYAGNHTMQVRTVDMFGNQSAALIVYNWSVVASSDTMLTLSGLADGPHTFMAYAVDSAGNEEPPHNFAWTVDTQPPKIVARLITPQYSNQANVTVQLSCDSENASLIATSSCLFCWSLDNSLRRDCGRDTTMRLASPEGSHSLSIIAFDAANNENSTAVVLSWTTDFSPPTTQVSVSTVNMFVPSLSRTIVTSSTVLVTVSAALSKPVGSFLVYQNGVLNRTVVGTTGNVTVPDGAVTLLIKAVDLAGNVDPAGYTTSMVVDTTPPRTFAESLPAPLSNSTTVTFSARGFDALSLVGFQLLLSPPSVSVPAFAGLTSGNITSLTLLNVPPGRYNISARAVDAVGLVDPVGLLSSFVIDTAPPVASFLPPVPIIVANTTVVLRTQTVDTQSITATYYRLNRTDWLPLMTSTLTLTNLPQGRTLAELRAVDAAGNWQTTSPNISFTVDTIAPVMTWMSVPRPYTNSTFVQPCVAIRDASAVTVMSWLDGVRVSVNSDTGCAPAIVNAPGLHSFLFSAVDAAGNAAPNLTTSWLMDAAPPDLNITHDGCVTRFQKTVCSARDMFRALVSCDAGASAVPISPCTVKWRLAAYPGDAVSCASVNSTGGLSSANVSAWYDLPNDGLVTFNVDADGRYDVYFSAVDGSGNALPDTVVEYWVDTVPPPEPSYLQLSESDTQASMLANRTATVVMKLSDDTSPGITSYLFNMTTGGNPYNDRVPVPVPSPWPTTSDLQLSLTFTGLAADTSYEVRVWSIDQGGLISDKWVTVEFVILSSVPIAEIIKGPAQVSADLQPVFYFKASWGNGSEFNNIPLTNVRFEVQLDSGVYRLINSDASMCNFTMANPVCKYISEPVTPGTHTLQVRTVLSDKRSLARAKTWEYRQCSPIIQYNYVLPTGDLECRKCETGMDCSQPAAVVAAPGYWTDASDPQSFTYYACPIRGSCLGGGSFATDNTTYNNVTLVSRCSVGYTGLLCGTCETGYFQQYDTCVICPKQVGVSVAVILAIVLAFVLSGYILFRLRDLLPIVQIKVGVSMLQIIASANQAYDIPWPSAFRTYLNYMKVVLVDVAAMLPANCTETMTYYKSLVIVLVSFKAALLVIVVGPWLVGRIQAIRCTSCRRLSNAVSRFRAPVVEVETERDAQLRGWPQEAVKVQSLRESLMATLQQSKIFRASFMFLFLAYPGVTLKIFRMFKCRKIGEHSFLVADLRLQCFTPLWGGYAIYAGVMGILYAFGLPFAAMYIPYKRRHKLFGITDAAKLTKAKWGFLYESYGSTAWWWETEELLRKLILSAIVVLMDEGTPLQVSVAVLVSGWAHVMHATYKPWGRGNPTYLLQHISLFVTFFMFLMGLLFKVNSVGQESTTFTALSIIMLIMCIGFMVAWVVLMGRVILKNYNEKRMARLQASSKADLAEFDRTGGKNASKDSIRAIQNPMLRRALESKESGGETKGTPSVPYKAPAGMKSSMAPGADGMHSNPLRRGGDATAANPLLRQTASLDPQTMATLAAAGRTSTATKFTRKVQRQAARAGQAGADLPGTVEGAPAPRKLKLSIATSRPTVAPAATFNRDLLRQLELADSGATPGSTPPASPVKAARVPSANPLLRQGAPEVKSMGAESQQGSPDSPRKLVSVRGVARTLKSPTAAGQPASPAAAAGPVDPLAAANPLKARMAAASASRAAANPLLTAGGLLPAKEGDMNSNPLFANKIKAAAAPAPPGTASLMIARSSAVGKMTGVKGKSRIKKLPSAASGAAKEDDE